MAHPQQSLAHRFAHAVLQLVLRFWPEESRDWGQALAAELGDIEKPLDVLTWALGGLMLFTRASVAHLWNWLKLPVGARPSKASLPLGANPHIFPKRSRLFTVAVLVAIVAVLFLPQSREAISTVRESWTGYQASSSDLRALEKLAVQAENHKDARTLAFVALSLPDRERGILLADRAVALDPTLAWIYASRVDSRNFSQLTKERVARLLASDPNNAYAQLIAVQSVYVPDYTALLSRHTLTDQEIEAAVTGDPDWAAQMDLAFSSPRYDSYLTRDWQLTQEVWNREPSLPASLAFYSLCAHSFPDILSIKAYSNRLVRSAQEASSAGDRTRAQSLLLQLDAFGRLMTDQGERDFERLYGLHLSLHAITALHDLYIRTGNSSLATAAADRLQHINARRDALLANVHGSDQQPQTRILERRAFLVQFSAVFAILLVLATAFSLLAWELRREKSSRRLPLLHRAICLAVDWAPVALLAAFIALLWAFQPFANILRSARSINSASAAVAWQAMHFQGLFLLSKILGPLFDPMTAYNFWLAFLCALVALFLFLVARGFLRHKPA